MICGVDCGQSGALALLDRDGRPLALADMPAVKVKIGGTWRPRTDPHGLRALLAEWAPAHVVVEEITPRRDDAPQSSKQDAVVLAMARSLIKIGGASSKNIIEARAAASQEPLRGQLRQLLVQGS